MVITVHNKTHILQLWNIFITFCCDRTWDKGVDIDWDGTCPFIATLTGCGGVVDGDDDVSANWSQLETWVVFYVIRWIKFYYYYCALKGRMFL